MAMLLITLLMLMVMIPCITGPGLFVLRRLCWLPSERLLAGTGLSLLWIYLASLFIRTVLLHPVWHSVLLAANLFMAGLAWRQYGLILRRASSRRIVWVYLLVLGFAALALALVRNFSGGEWAADFFEHHDRALFFAGRFPIDTLFIGIYPLPARPPLMNAVAGHFITLAGTTFEVHQVCMLALNVLAAPALALVAGVLAPPRARRRPWAGTLVAMLVCSPMFVQNSVFGWTKLLTAMYVLLGLSLYLAAVRKNDSTRLVGAAASLAAGLLVHYSAGPYVLAVTAHYLWVTLAGRCRWGEATGAALAALLVLGTWFGWSIRYFGLRGTLASNTTVTSSADLAWGQNLAKIAANLFDTLVPHVLRSRRIEVPVQVSGWGQIRDLMFYIYQVNLPLAMGLVGGPVVLALLWRRLVRQGDALSLPARRERRFWTWAVPLIVVAGVAVVGERDRWGVAHLCLQPLVLLGVALLAVSFPGLPRLVRLLVAVGAAVDVLLGVLLQAHLSTIVYAIGARPDGSMFLNGVERLNQQSGLNWISKVTCSIAYVADHLAWAQWLIRAMLAMAAGSAVMWLLHLARKRRMEA